ncbi:uncharacterized protein LOC104430630 isoform X2 [Eucalyptus grandis]|uniref:uncharacterized protein LOC104430630 isoform X2 n=1 Tax=Eucalyptus grandis TaxID=71139 RepID=UPI00192EEB18|nr:uncharacterized protein LOC104430630 isoform X2 [Eucalyptus grandis]
MAATRLEQPHHHQQHIVVMRHGDRLDNVDRSWPATAPKRWDPPLAEVGRDRARETAKQLPYQLGFPIHRIVVSPFRRCIDTALGLIAGLSAPGEDPNAVTSDNGIDSSKVKVSIEYGLSEMFNDVAIKYPPTNPVDHADWKFNNPEIEALIPIDTLDRTVKSVFNELPHWGETEAKARDRYLHTIRSLANSYPSENLLLITHGEAVKVALLTHLEEAARFEIKVNYCGYIQLRRSVVQSSEALEAGEFELLTSDGQSGVNCLPRTDM